MLVTFRLRRRDSKPYGVIPTEAGIRNFLNINRCPCEPVLNRRGNLFLVLYSERWLLQGHPNAPNDAQRWLYGSLRDSQKLACGSKQFGCLMPHFVKSHNVSVIIVAYCIRFQLLVLSFRIIFNSNQSPAGCICHLQSVSGKILLALKITG